ncbi:DUF6792 domain-containing protein [Parageobacillus thermoglucosidasius]|uniref:DUF6792 domain-containing protein n=1 Tax=Parageobacillus thermoglucosidasius TaxID=1426 RepID=UPI0030C6D25D
MNFTIEGYGGGSTVSQKLVLDTDLLRARVMSLEYKHLTAEEIRRIYIEETGSNPPAQTHVYHSEDFRNVNVNDSGFDGTIIHFYDEEKGINQMYTIARGSEKREKDTWKPLDWAYNALGIFVGQSRSQYRDALEFDRKVTQIITEELKRKGQTIELKKIGLGHSQGGNHAEMIQLTEHRFSQVYVINDAPPSAYQLAYIDKRFRYELAKKFTPNILSDYNLIYSIPPSELKAFAEEYYKKQIDERSIYHLTAEEDLLYAVSGVRGFAELVHLIHQEMKCGRGQIIDETNEAVEQYQKRNLLSNDLYKNSMNTAAQRYTNMINDMRGQHITLYYDVIIREKKR